jgi:hypothetical protein
MPMMMVHVNAMLTAAFQKRAKHERERAAVVASVVARVLTVMAALLMPMLVLMREELAGVTGGTRPEQLGQKGQMLTMQTMLTMTTPPPCGRHQKNIQKSQAHPEKKNSCQHGRAACCCGANAGNRRPPEALCRKFQGAKSRCPDIRAPRQSCLTPQLESPTFPLEF